MKDEQTPKNNNDLCDTLFKLDAKRQAQQQSGKSTSGSTPRHKHTYIIAATCLTAIICGTMIFVSNKGTATEVLIKPLEAVAQSREQTSYTPNDSGSTIIFSSSRPDNQVPMNLGCRDPHGSQATTIDRMDNTISWIYKKKTHSWCGFLIDGFSITPDLHNNARNLEISFTGSWKGPAPQIKFLGENGNKTAPQRLSDFIIKRTDNGVSIARIPLSMFGGGFNFQKIQFGGSWESTACHLQIYSIVITGQ